MQESVFDSELVREASSVVGMELDGVDIVTERKMRGKLKVLMDSPCHPYPRPHPLYAELRKLRSTFSYRLIQPQASKRLGGSFIPSAIRLHNSTAPTPPSTTQHLPRPPPN